MGLYPSSFFLKTHDISGKEAMNLVDPLDWVILSHWPPQKLYLVQICTWEQV